MSESMDMDDEQQNFLLECICDRPMKTVFCSYCGYMGSGRLKIPCKAHPRRQMLLDIICCPFCRTNIDNMREQEILSDFPVPTYDPRNTRMENPTYPVFSEPQIHLPIPEMKPLYGIGRGISPLKRSSLLYPNGSLQTQTEYISPQTQTEYVSPLKRDCQFQRFPFPNNDNVRRPGTFRER